MSVPGARYQAAERAFGGGRSRAALEMGGISVCCVAFRATRSRLLRVQITRDSCRYRA